MKHNLLRNRPRLAPRAITGLLRGVAVGAFIALAGFSFSPAYATSHPSGKISWYGDDFHGKRTASGRTYNKNDFTAAHPSLPFGTVLRVYSLKNNRQVLVEVTDRGPFSKDRLVDVSRRAAKSLGLITQGVGRAAIEVVARADGTPIAKDNAFYLRLTNPMPEQKAAMHLAAVQQKLPGKQLRVLCSTTSAKKNAVVALGPYKSFRQARMALAAGNTALADATIIEAPKTGDVYVQNTPQKPVLAAKKNTASLSASNAPRKPAKQPVLRRDSISSASKTRLP